MIGTIKAEVKIMLAVKGTIQGNTVVIKDEDIKKYDGKDVIVTILDFQFEQQKKQVDLTLCLFIVVIPIWKGKIFHTSNDRGCQPFSIP